MRPNRTNIVLLVVLAAALAANWYARDDPAARAYEFAPQMAHSPRYGAFSPNPNFDDGQTLRLPEPGTIPRGLRPLGYGATPAEAARAGQELHSPIAAGDSTAEARGAVVFANFCQPCHGARGLGDGVVAQRGFPPPPSLIAPHALELPDGRMFHILSYGQGNMASYASQLSRDDRWKVIRHVRTLQGAAVPPVAGARP